MIGLGLGALGIWLKSWNVLHVWAGLGSISSIGTALSSSNVRQQVHTNDIWHHCIKVLILGVFYWLTRFGVLRGMDIEMAWKEREDRNRLEWNPPRRQIYRWREYSPEIRDSSTELSFDSFTYRYHVGRWKFKPCSCSLKTFVSGSDHHTSFASLVSRTFE